MAKKIFELLLVLVILGIITSSNAVFAMTNEHQSENPGTQPTSDSLSINNKDQSQPEKVLPLPAVEISHPKDECQQQGGCSQKPADQSQKVVPLAQPSSPIDEVRTVTHERRKETPNYGLVSYWQLKNWEDQQLLCEIFIKHDNFPTDEEIETYCGSVIYQNWISTPPCSAFLSTGDATTCKGSYLVDLGKYTLKYTEMEPLPKSEAHYSIIDCQLGEWCSKKPTLRISGTEPLSEYKINAVKLSVGDRFYTCNDADSCDYPIELTTNQGIWVEYWVVSSFGDTSLHQTIHLRSLYRNKNGGEYLVDVLSPDNADIDAAIIWDMFPTVDHPDGSLFQKVAAGDQLKTSHRLYYLAGKLINEGRVVATECAQNGLLDNGMANTCGEEKAHTAVVDWQNQFDQLILQAASAHHMPARIIKSMIIQESQFWSDTGIQHEYGMGSLSEQGVDVLLTWDLPGFLAECVPIYGKEVCSSGYANLSQEHRSYLRGLVMQAIGTDKEIDLLTRILRADSIQMGQIIQNLTGNVPNKTTTYEEMWYFTIASYNGGAGCIADGIKKLLKSRQEINLMNFCNINTSCPMTCTYVEQILNYAR